MDEYEDLKARKQHIIEQIEAAEHGRWSEETIHRLLDELQEIDEKIDKLWDED